MFVETLHYCHYCQREVIVIWIKSLSNTLVSVYIHLLQIEQINFWLRRSICSIFQLYGCTAESATSSRTIPYRLLTTGNYKWSDSSFESGCISVACHTSLKSGTSMWHLQKVSHYTGSQVKQYFSHLRSEQLRLLLNDSHVLGFHEVMWPAGQR